MQTQHKEYIRTDLAFVNLTLINQNFVIDMYGASIKFKDIDNALSVYNALYFCFSDVSMRESGFLNDAKFIALCDFIKTTSKKKQGIDLFWAIVDYCEPPMPTPDPIEPDKYNNGKTFEGINFSGASVPGCEFANCSFKNCLFVDSSILYRCINCSFSLCNFSRAELINFENCEFDGCKFEKSKCNNTSFSDCRIDKFVLKKCNPVIIGRSDFGFLIDGGMLLLTNWMPIFKKHKIS